MSKIRNISLIEKKWMEKDTRELENGSNPHSNGDIFSRSSVLCVLIKGITLMIKIKIILITMIK